MNTDYKPNNENADGRVFGEAAESKSFYILYLFSGTGEVFLEVEVNEYTHVDGK